MKANTTKYIVPLLLPALAAGCADDELLTSGPQGNPDAITFAAFTVDAVEQGRSRGVEKPLYDPLTLTGDAGETTLYLHTYETNRIGGRPGDDAEPQTRAQQVTTATLAAIHKNFSVIGHKSVGGETYFHWSETHVADQENNIWYTGRTEYWPASEELTFHAVSPASELNNLNDLSAHSGLISFGYTARKGSADKDAELQNDLLLSSYACDKHTHTGQAPLDFHHALSAVKFAVRDVLDGEVVNIKVAGVNSQGTCTFDKNADGEFAVSWSGQQGSETYSQNFNYRLTGQGVVDPSDESEDKLLNDAMPEKTFMLIPQRIPDDAEIIVTLRRDNVDTAAGASSEITVRGKIKANNVEEWLPGHEYVYTISTSKDNWVYVFDAQGNEAEGTGNIYVYSPNDDNFATLGNEAYYLVRSYRYRANDQDYKEPLPWTASYTGSESYQVNGSSDVLYEGKWISAEKWITDLEESKFSGSGSTTYARHNIEMYPHYLVTDWAGDKKMQLNAPYNQAMLNKATPYDLSKPNGQLRSTANCYIVDRGGWYCIPLVYGNAIKKGATISSAYTCSASGTVLKTFTDYNGNNITNPYITGGKSASLVWQDAYDMLDEVELVKINGEDMIRFFVEKENLQQGNAIVALKDASGTIMWSWHIWATEHWLDPNGLPNAMSNDAFFNWKLNPVTQVRESGDAKVTKNQAGNTFYMSPYTLGWCDPKNVIYLKRKTDMKFVQYMPDGTALTGKKKTIPVIQQGETVNYKIGNNPYYQWGRKDPQVGFVDRQKNFKANFGPTSFRMDDNKDKTIKDGIRNPHIMYVHTKEGEHAPDKAPDQQDWIKSSYWNLWNNSANVTTGGVNSSTDASTFSHLKTVYDPCPIGYVIPNSGVWQVLGGSGNLQGTAYNNDPKFGGNLNGKTGRKLDAIPDGIYVYEIYGTGSASDQSNHIYLFPTGNRWYSNGHVFKEVESIGQETTIKAGLNFNLRMFYGWSSQWLTYQGNRGSYAGAVGMDAYTSQDYYLGAKFAGRRAMGRPVRAIRDPNF